MQYSFINKTTVTFLVSLRIHTHYTYIIISLNLISSMHGTVYSLNCVTTAITKWHIIVDISTLAEPGNCIFESFSDVYTG